ncbi:MAG: hypothetical protein ACQESR_04430 [Planctomycetota bacterium]
MRYSGLILVIFLPSTILASEPGPNYQHLKHLQQIIGHWQYVGKDERGQRVHGSETNTWGPHKNYVRVEGMWHAEPSPPITYELMIRWDPETRQEVLNGMLSNGAVFRRAGNYDREKNATISRETSIAPDGTKYTSVCTIKFGDKKDSWAATWTNCVQDGVRMQDSHIKAVRVNTSQALPKKVVRELDHMVGHWKMSGRASKGQLEGIWSLKWAPGKQCLIGDYRASLAGEDFRCSDLYGWDAMEEEFVLLSVFTGGDIEIGRTKLIEPSVQKGSYSVSIDGKKYEATIEIRRKGHDEFVVRTTGLADQGIGELKLRGVRIKTDDGATGTTKNRGKRKRMNAKERFQRFWNYASGTWETNGGPARLMFKKMPQDRYVLVAADMHAVIEWDDHMGKWKQSSITDRGRFDVTFSVKDGRLVGESTEYYFDTQERGSSQWRFEKENNNRYRLILHNVRRNGKKRPDRTHVLDRVENVVPSAEKTATKEEFDEYCAAMEGRWYNVDEKIAEWVDFGSLEKKTVSHATNTPTADGQGLSGDFYAGKGAGKWLTVWNPVTRQIQILCVLSDGTVWEEIRYKHHGNWQCEVTLNRPGGTKQAIHSVLKISKDGNTHQYHDPEKALPPGVYHRVAK